MKIEADKPSSGQGISQVRISHRGETIRWDTSKAYCHTSKQSASEDVITATHFDEINGFIASLSKGDQDRLWNCFRQARTLLSESIDVLELRGVLRGIVKEIYEICDLVELRKWLDKNIDIVYPSSVLEKLDQNYASRPSDTTYIREDYRGLITLLVAYRLMIPIWGEYIAVSPKDNPPNNREAHAYRLLYDSSVIRSPEVQRLQRFIEAMIDKTTSSDKFMIPTLRGLGSAEAGVWLTAMVSVRRLTMASISTPLDRPHMISRIYTFVENKTGTLDRDMGSPLGGKISDKRVTGGSDDTTSLVDAYKIKPDITDGDIAMLNCYASDPYMMLQARCPEVPREYLDQCLEIAAQVQTTDFNQTYLTKLVIHRVIPHRGVDLLTIEALRNCMAVAQACLWHWGFYSLAALVTSIPKFSEDDFFVGGVVETRTRLTRDQLDRMQALYPHTILNKKNAPPNPRQTNIAARAADHLASILFATDWELRAPPALLAKLDRRNENEYYTIPPDIRVIVGNLYIHPEISESE